MAPPGSCAGRWMCQGIIELPWPPRRSNDATKPDAVVGRYDAKARALALTGYFCTRCCNAKLRMPIVWHRHWPSLGEVAAPGCTGGGSRSG